MKADHRNRNPPGGRRLAGVAGSAVRSSCDGLVLGTAEHSRIPLTHRCHTSQSVPTPHCALAAYSQRSSSVAAAHARSEVRARGCPDRRCPPNAHRLRTQNDQAHPQPPDEGIRSESGVRTSGDIGNGEGGRLLGGAPGSASLLEVLWAESGPTSDARQHTRTNLLAVVKRENKVRPSGARKHSM